MGWVNRLFGVICRKNLLSNTKASGRLVRSMAKVPGTSVTEQRTKESGCMTYITASVPCFARKEILDMKANGRVGDIKDRVPLPGQTRRPTLVNGRTTNVLGRGSKVARNRA